MLWKKSLTIKVIGYSFIVFHYRSKSYTETFTAFDQTMKKAPKMNSNQMGGLTNLSLVVDIVSEILSLMLSSAVLSKMCPLTLRYQQHNPVVVVSWKSLAQWVSNHVKHYGRKAELAFVHFLCLNHKKEEGSLGMKFQGFNSSFSS